MIVPAGEGALAAAADCLGRGEIVAVPTDTVYGLAVDPTREGATRRLFAAKDRPASMPIAVLVADAEQAWTLASVPLPWFAADLAGRHWPGALTIIVERAPGWTADLGDEGRTVGLRCPNHAWMRALCRRAGPLATTSANVHGKPTADTPENVMAAMGGHVSLVVDGGRLEGAPSTVVDCTRDVVRVVREGRIAARALGVPYDSAS